MTDLDNRLAALEAAVNRMADQTARDLKALSLSVDFVRTHLSSYLGNGRALTYMVGDIPIFINSDDAGGPSNLLNGGLYETDNLELLLSFVTPDTTFLDIGANLGFFAVSLGIRMLRTAGRIHAFEPHPELSQLLWRSTFLNGLDPLVSTHAIGVGDRDSEVEFGYPIGHLGGGGALPAGFPSAEAGGPQLIRVRAPIRRLDDVMPAVFRCDLVKIDVEGGEAAVLRGMENIIRRSPRIKILLEKIERDEAHNRVLWDILHEFDLKPFAISASAHLTPLTTFEAFTAIAGYVFASKDEINDLARARFSLYPPQMFGHWSSDAGSKRIEVPADQVLTYGPYWPLRGGEYRISFVGEVKGPVRVRITERAGHLVAEAVSRDGQDVTVQIGRDLSQFECVLRSMDGPVAMSLERIDMVRL